MSNKSIDVDNNAEHVFSEENNAQETVVLEKQEPNPDAGLSSCFKEPDRDAYYAEQDEKLEPCACQAEAWTQGYDYAEQDNDFAPWDDDSPNDDDSGHQEPWQNSKKMYALYHHSVPISRIEKYVHTIRIDLNCAECKLNSVARGAYYQSINEKEVFWDRLTDLKRGIEHLLELVTQLHSQAVVK